MRLLLAVFLLAACGGPSTAGPKWPKMTEKETDGGESIAPRAKASAVAAAASKDDDDDDAKAAKDAKPADKPAADKPAADAETPKPAATTGSAQAPDEIIITTEEIVIEIDE